jgi:hypothetical protein
VIFYEATNFDEFVKSQKSRHSCESRSPELFELTGFPLPRERQKWVIKDFLRDHQFLFDNICDDGYNGAKKQTGKNGIK